MPRDIHFNVYTTFEWISALWVQYLAQKYGRSWNEAICAMLHEYVVADRRNIDFEQVKRQVLDSDEFRALSGNATLEVLTDLDVLQARRDDPKTEARLSVSVYAGRKRNRPWIAGVQRLTFSRLDYALVEYYAKAANITHGNVIRRMIRGYMLADSRMAQDDFSAFVATCKRKIDKKHWPEIDDGLKNILRERERVKKVRKAKKAAEKEE